MCVFDKNKGTKLRYGEKDFDLGTNSMHYADLGDIQQNIFLFNH